MDAPAATRPRATSRESRRSIRAIDLQSRFLYPRRAQSTVTVKTKSGEQFDGKLLHIDEFDVAMTDKAGWHHSWPRDEVKYTVHDPLERHRELLRKYTDADMHNMFAYLETLQVKLAAISLAAGGRRILTRSRSRRAACIPRARLWPTYNGDYSGRRFSPLDQINESNVSSLALAWAFRTNTVRGEVDAAHGQRRPVFHRSRSCLGHRRAHRPPDLALPLRLERRRPHRQSRRRNVQRLALLRDARLPSGLPECRRTARCAGRSSWATSSSATSPPWRRWWLANHVIVGVSGDVTDVPGYLDSRDPETGKLQWRWYTAPKPGEPGSETWPKNSDAITHGGGMTWMTGTYDPELNLVYWGTGNPNPVLAGEGRHGDNSTPVRSSR